MAVGEAKDPESLEGLKQVKITQGVIDFVEKVAKDVADEKAHRSEWENRIDNYTRKRYGIRSKKNFPWVGSANFVLPQIDSDINRIKPAYINMGFGVSPIVSFEPYGPEDVLPAKKREILFDWRMRTQVKFFQPYAINIDYLLHNGFTLFKTGWKFELRTYTKYLDLTEQSQAVLDALYMPEVNDDMLMQIFAEEIKPDLTLEENIEELRRVVGEFREGKSKFEFNFVEKAENRAEVVACDPREDVVFPIDTCDIQEARFIDYKFWKSKNSIKRDMKSGKYQEFEDYEIDQWCQSYGGNTSADFLKNLRNGTTYAYNTKEDSVLMHEIWTWYDVNDDGIDEKVCITFPDSDPTKVLRFIENPYDHGQFPYVVIRREFNDAEIMSSRGIPALDDDFQTGISTLFNQDIDAGTITTSPTIVARKNSVKNLRNLRYVPGQVVETENGTADYTVVQNTNLGQANRFNNMQYLKAWANDRIGNMTAAISSTNNTQGQGPMGAKTAREVAAIESQSGMLQSMDLLVFQVQMADVYYQIDSLYWQFGDETEEMMITGQGPVRISRQEMQGRFNIVPNGRVDNANPAMRAQRALNILQMFANDPFIRQDQLRKMYLDELDLRVSQMLLKTPQEMQIDAQQGMMAENDKLKTVLHMQMAKDNLEIRKEAMMVPIQGRKYASD